MDCSVTQMFMFLHRCACVEPSDPTNDTLKYWTRTNVTASEIYWEALEVKVQSSLKPDAECKNGRQIRRQMETMFETMAHIIPLFIQK